MKNTFGNNVAVTLFGESHGECIGAVIDGLAPGMCVDNDYIRHMLSLRRPQGDFSTPRVEKDDFKIVSGILNGKTTGTPLTILIPNENVQSAPYTDMARAARPSHADYTAEMKYHGFQDARGGGHFSGRLTAAVVAAGAICKQALEKKGITIGTRIKRCAKISDREWGELKADLDTLNQKTFATLDDAKAEEMKAAILDAKSNGDSVGGILETVVLGMPAGIGEPYFDTMESMLSHALFSIPALKGVEFGAGFSLCDMRGSESNDPMQAENGKVVTTTNHAGGICGGITNGMPLIFSTAIKPTPTIARAQNTVDLDTLTDTVLEARGRHDPAIVHRARVVQDAVTALGLCDMIATHLGTDALNA
ncbi:MAG: chorismate synthase [Clostridia bacterium]|nr:chorismate synthase [Clostridia bacterium]